MIRILMVLGISLSLAACVSSPAPSYYYNNGYGSATIPLDNKSKIRLPIGKSRGKVAITSPYGNIRL